jgi:hypothetical protein
MSDEELNRLYRAIVIASLFAMGFLLLVFIGLVVIG